jgi:hypothetical protein
MVKIIRRPDDPEKAKIYDEAIAILNSGRVKPGFEGLTDEEALKVIMIDTGYDEHRARFILAQERGELPDETVDDEGKKIKIIY